MDFRVEKRRFDEGNSSAIIEENRRFYANRTVRFASSKSVRFCVQAISISVIR
ncbi:MAG: hypothetical protein PHI19_04915 [Clostridia bacterium]|nr:hypothetical protein [Clostridia bacterium]